MLSSDSPLKDLTSSYYDVFGGKELPAEALLEDFPRMLKTAWTAGTYPALKDALASALQSGEPIRDWMPFVQPPHAASEPDREAA